MQFTFGLVLQLAMPVVLAALVLSAGVTAVGVAADRGTGASMMLGLTVVLVVSLVFAVFAAIAQARCGKKGCKNIFLGE